MTGAEIQQILLANPHDEVQRLVFADHFEEIGNPERAARLRSGCICEKVVHCELSLRTLDHFGTINPGLHEQRMDFDRAVWQPFAKILIEQGFDTSRWYLAWEDQPNRRFIVIQHEAYLCEGGAWPFKNDAPICSPLQSNNRWVEVRKDNLARTLSERWQSRYVR